jgi:hypothetical protein
MPLTTLIRQWVKLRVWVFPKFYAIKRTAGVEIHSNVLLLSGVESLCWKLTVVLIYYYWDIETYAKCLPFLLDFGDLVFFFAVRLGEAFFLDTVFLTLVIWEVLPRGVASSPLVFECSSTWAEWSVTSFDCTSKTPSNSSSDSKAKNYTRNEWRRRSKWSRRLLN